MPTLQKHAKDYPIRDIFFNEFASYAKKHALSAEQRKAGNAISACKTGRLGYNVNSCENCGTVVRHANSCRNRNCPNCQNIKKELWVDARSAEVIDGPYYHVVFTVPRQLNALFASNKKQLYTLIHNCAAHSVLELAADKKFGGFKPAIIQLLHTWGQRMNYHPHIHSIISGSGLTPSGQLKCSGNHFFIPVKVLANKFRGKFMALLKELYNSNKLVIPACNSEWNRVDDWNAFCFSMYGLEWNVNIKETFNGNGNAIEYLGRYSYRIAISNNRVQSYSKDKVVFSAKDYVTGNQITVERTTEKFIADFLRHVLPSRFQKIRYYGLLSNRHKAAKLKTIFRLQGRQKFRRKFINFTPAQIIMEVWNFDITVCPCCHKPFHLIE